MRSGRFLPAAALWVVFFGIAFGLGYPTLNRYDPAATGGVADAAFFGELLVEGAETVPPPWRYRRLVPALAAPLYHLSSGRIGSWDARWFALLVVNSALVAGAAVLVAALGQLTGPPPVALLGALVYLLNFSVANFHLAGLVDSAEAILFAALALTLTLRRWEPFPVWCAVGAAAKETFLPLAVVFAFGWWLFERDGRRGGAGGLAWILGGGAAGILSYALVQSATEGYLVPPWALVMGRSPDLAFTAGLWASVASLGILYTLAWLGPLAVPNLRAYSQPLLAATALASLAAILLGGWAGIEGNLARPIFSVAGPVLSLAAARTLLAILPRGPIRTSG
jgi:hypothetical protein